MAIMKCKMCGGDLNVTEGVSVVECEYCGSRQTIPSQDSEKKLTLFARADRLRRACEFDKAAGVYESIVAEFPQEAEAYWGLVLCRYGIEYVDDPATGKKVPTCHRSSFDSILEDADFDQACENADAIARRQYREEAKVIEDIRKGILEVSGKEEPYDIFICYKETDENGGRTIDSVIAQDVYDALTEKGYRVFFSRISLEDKLGTEYEPYIFAALNSAKVMLAFGTDYEYFNAVWVKNEWSRFLALMAAGQKKTLIPCYKNLDAYDMPKEFQRLQAQDMGKVGAVQDLLRGIEKIIPRETGVVEKTVVVQQSAVPAGPGVASLLKRAQLFLEDGDFKSANEYFDKVLDIDPENGEAYLGMAMAGKELRDWDDLSKGWTDELEQDRNVCRAVQYAGPELAGRLEQVKQAYRELKERRRAELIPKLKTRRELIAKTKHLVVITTAGSILAVRADGTVDVALCDQEKDDAMLAAVQEWTDIAAIYSLRNIDIIVGLRSDGTVVAAGKNQDGECDVQDWTDVVDILLEEEIIDKEYHGVTLGLKSDGTVVATGSNKTGKCDVEGWKDIKALARGPIGIRKDGTLAFTRAERPEIADILRQCRDIVRIDDMGSRAIKSDGTAVLLRVGVRKYAQQQVSSWTGIVDTTYLGVLVGLRADGTVAVVKTSDEEIDEIIKDMGDVFKKLLESEREFYDMEKWTNIAALAGDYGVSLGLKLDGTIALICSSEQRIKQPTDVPSWRKVVGIFVSYNYIVGIQEDGHLLIQVNTDFRAEVYEKVKAEVIQWRLFNSIDTLEQDRQEAMAEYRRKAAEAEAERQRQEEERRCQEEERQRQEEERRRQEAEAARQAKITALNDEKQSLQRELANLKGLFSGKRRREIETRLAQIEAELKKL